MEFRMKVTKLEIDGTKTTATLDRLGEDGKKDYARFSFASVDVTDCPEQFPIGSEHYVELVPVPKLQIVPAKEIPAPAPA